MENVMPDICDHANDEMEFLNLMEFLNQITLSRPHPPSQPSATHCCDCNRREALPGVRRCVDCQSILEYLPI
ncbi:TraR/DksA C4-type zinc finger protein [Citrobacter portucalensis]|uniref:TraR/DksA C4-type zinc finger protein n=1 Tax=Citrobacter portucalensis TaxID=1639133 RepID=UPI0039FCF4CB